MCSHILQAASYPDATVQRNETKTTALIKSFQWHTTSNVGSLCMARPLHLHRARRWNPWQQSDAVEQKDKSPDCALQLTYTEQLQPQGAPTAAVEEMAQSKHTDSA